jgi:hypothetical protein
LSKSTLAVAAAALDRSTVALAAGFLIGEIDQIHKMDRVSQVTSIWVFGQGCLHHEGI